MSFRCNLLGNVRFGNEIYDILKLKGIEDIESFLNPTNKCLENPHLFTNINRAVKVYTEHVSKCNEMDLLVDCDCDGNTAASNIYQYTKRINPKIKINCFIHKGKSHGLSDVVEEMCQDNSRLVIIPDAGTGDIEECAKLYACGKDVIILDHHKISDEYNPAIVVNNQLSEKITDKAMTGVGITYKFTQLLDEFYGVNYADDYLDLVAFGMIGDRANMTNLQTRYLILKGLEQMQNKTNKNKLLRTFVEAQMYVMNWKVTINGVGFYMNPLMNSLIRLGEFEDKRLMFEALCNSDKMLERKVRGKGMVLMSIQEYILKACQSTNRKQRKLTAESSKILSEEIDKTGLNKYSILICNARDNVDSNSTGLIANRLSDQYQRPCLLMRRKDNICKGSGRGNDKCEILDFNKWCKDTNLFEFVDGHDNAFGCSIKFENTYKLFQLISNMKKIDEPTYHIYGIYEANKLHDQNIRNVAKYNNVWGSGVDEPLFLIQNVNCNKYNINLIGTKQNKIEFMYHNIKFTKQTKGSSLATLYKEIIETGDNIEFTIVGRFTLDHRNGDCPQVMIEDMEFKKSNVTQGFGM